MPKIRSMRIFLLIAVFAAAIVLQDVCALGDDQSKVAKESYEKLIEKNLELRDEITSLIKAQDELKEIYRVLLEKVKALQLDKNALTKDKEGAAAAAAEAKRTIENLKRELALAQKKIASMGKSISETAVAAKKEDNTSYEKRLTDLENTLKGSEERYKKSVSEKELLRQELNKIKEKIDKEEKRSKGLTSDLESQYAETGTQTKKIDELSKRLEKALAEEEAGAKELENMRASLQDKDSQIKAQYAKIAEYEETLKKLDELKKALGTKENEAKASSSALKEKEAALEKMMQGRASLEEKVKSLERDIQAGEKDAAKNAQELNDAGRKIEELRKNLNASGDKVKGKEKEVADLFSSRKAQDDRIRALETKLSDSKIVIELQSNRLALQQERIIEMDAKFKAESEGIKVADTPPLAKKKDEKKEPKEANIIKPNEAEELKSSPAAARVNDSITKIEAHRNEIQARSLALRSDIDKSVAEKETLRNKLKDLTSKIKDLNNEIETAKANAKNEAKRTAAVEERIKTLEKSLTKAADEERDADSRLQEAVSKVRQLEASDKAAAEKAANGAGAQTKDEAAKSIEKDFEAATGAEKEAGERLQQAEEKVGAIKDAIAAERSKIEDRTPAKIEAEQENIKTLQGSAGKLTSDMRDANKSFQGLKKKIKGMNVMYDKMLADIKSDESEIADLKQIITKQVDEIQNVEHPAQEAAVSSSANPARGAAVTAGGDTLATLKAKNVDLEKEAKAARDADKKDYREAEYEKKLTAQMARKMKKESVDMHYNLGVVYDMNGMYKDAEREYLNCLKIDSNDSGVHYNLGILYDDKLNDDHKAEQHYRKYLELKPMGENAMQVRQWLIDIQLEQRLGKEAR